MASVVDICNLALSELGEEFIIALTEASKSARLCSLFYEVERDNVLRAHPWNFAIKRVELAKLTISPSFDYDNSFQLPSDCLKVLFTDDKKDMFKVEGRSLLTNNASVKIAYISRIEDSTMFDSIFTVALSQKIASKLAYNLSDNNSLVQIMESKAKATIRKAKSMDGQEGVVDNIEANEWLLARQ